MSEAFNNIINDKINKELLNQKACFERQRNPPDVEFSDKQFMFEQYKLLIDSVHKVEERRGVSNNFFVSINTILISFVLTNPLKTYDVAMKYIPLLALLVLVGIIISWDWLRVIDSYKKLNYINYSLTQALEKLLPTCIFSLRGEIEAMQAAQKPSNRFNVILIQEKSLPQLFLLIYSLYLLIIIFVVFAKL